MSEVAFMVQVRELARLYGWLEYHTRDSRGSAAGFPDLTLVRRGRVIFAELKTLAGRLRAEQVVWGEALAAVGGPVEYHVWRPDDFDAIQEVLR